MSNAYQITDTEIMIFGGKSAVTFQIFDGVFIFDLERMAIKERGSLVNPCSFMNIPLVFNHNLYAYGNDIYIHRYNIPEQKWTCIPKVMVWENITRVRMSEQAANITGDAHIANSEKVIN